MDKTSNNQGVFILFGATGDLSKRRIIPALYALSFQNKIGNISIIGIGLEDALAIDVINASKPYIDNFDAAHWAAFESRFFYYKMDVTQFTEFYQLKEFVESHEKEHAFTGNRLVYLAVHPKFFAPITEQLAQVNLIYTMSTPTDISWCRIAYEKPFGLDKKSAQEINTNIAQYLQEFQIFRVDHYLAKDIVGTIALLRFTNCILEPLWNNQHIDWVEIVLSETATMGGRGTFYDACGALKDVVQNHMLQIVALLAMESPEFLSGEYIREQKSRILKKIEPLDGFLAQYKGYRQEQGVHRNSDTETFAALKLLIHTPRWQQTPFYLRTGKGLNKKETVITIQFKPVTCLLTTHCPSIANYLSIRVMPEPGFSIKLNVKKPGMKIEVVPVEMDFCYECKFSEIHNNVYQLVLQELFLGEQGISVRFDEVEHAWEVIDKIKKLSLPLYHYEQGSSGPEELYEFARKNNMKWRL